MSRFQMLAMGLCLIIFLCISSPVACFRFTKQPKNPLVVLINKNKNVTFRWEWTLGGGVLNHLKIGRYEKSKPIPTLKTLVTYYSSVGSQGLDTTKFSLDVDNSNNGHANFVIKDITNQGNNQDETALDIMKKVYVYAIELNFPLLKPNEYASSVELKVLKTPVITKYPQNQTASGGTVTFKCVADGKPKPVISWEKIGSSVNYPQGETLTLANFDASKIGVYRCTAKSFGITENATGVGYVQYSTCVSGCDKEEIGIEMTNLTYNYEYSSASSRKYRELKSSIECACLVTYAKRGKAILKCEVQRFREGSVVAVVELAWPSGTVDPKEPLLTAIKSGSFAGHTVKAEFVNSTSRPPTASSTASPATASPTARPTTPSNTIRSVTKYAIITTTTTTTICMPPNSTSKCENHLEQSNCSQVIAFCVTVIVLLVVLNILLAFLVWRFRLKLKEKKELNKRNRQVRVNDSQEQADLRSDNQRMHRMQQMFPQNVTIHSQPSSQNQNQSEPSLEPNTYQVLRGGANPPTYERLTNNRNGNSTA